MTPGDRKMTDADRAELLVNALTAIKRATLNGDVCPDVAWFGPGETLHDFCESVLDRVGGSLKP
jgi:hypothetical protein